VGATSSEPQASSGWGVRENRGKVEESPHGRGVDRWPAKEWWEEDKAGHLTPV
jgi:hypothetical protein